MGPKLLSPYLPSSSDPFDHRKASHLLRRTGFGARFDDVEKAVKCGLEKSVDRLFDEADDQEKQYQQTFAAINGHFTNFGDGDAVKAWWAYRMVTTRAPLREKLTLFWHGHFATSLAKVEDSALLHQQIETLRRLAWSNFRELVVAMAKDPAMLVWLDGQSSTKDHPNENFARELMELFTCGIGHYSEADVQEAARAFTGWKRERAAYSFSAEEHDSGLKHFLGKSGRFDGTDIVDILMQQAATPRFLARKLMRFFAAPDPSDEVVSEAAALLDRTRLNIKWFLRDLFLSRYFYSADCYRTRIASPAELVVGTVRALGARWSGPELVSRMDAMGQSLLHPPNVKGWDGEAQWINATSWAARISFAKTLSQLNDDGSFGANLDLGSVVPSSVKEPQQVVDQLAKTLFQDDLDTDVRRSLARRLVAVDEGDGLEKFRDDEDFRASRIRESLAIALALPEYQTC
jgi:uncharacterized protein (DUF1800 family)